MSYSVVVIDDEEYILRLMHFMLEAEGFTVFSASNVEEGMQLAQQQRPDVITVDLMMPETDGLEFLARKAEDEAIADIPSLVISAVGLQADLAQAVNLGADGVLPKPFSQQQLAAAVKELIG